MINLSNDPDKIHNYVIDLAVLAIKKSKIHPVDREFLKGHLNVILSIDPKLFIYYNLELENDLYSTQLFACLPEIWRNITLDDLLDISEDLTNVLSYFTLLKFTYKYIELDIINPILNSPNILKSEFFRQQIMEYLELQWNVLIKSESDWEDFKDGFIDVDYNEWVILNKDS